ncbi:terminase [Endozoicomonas sp. SM1973]|uniref:Terminase n=1 Tax=Spartinivicinus marinus TaxID=2994442 RepID=A0A853I5F1_9GAMM|nr:terminase [Spartinivicinus marinus]NYZ69120.1 terminase [Spartinivicinus marinus]
MSRPKNRSKARDKKFFDGIEAGYGIGLAAKQAGYTRTSVYRYRDEDPSFAESWDEARENYIEELEAEADRRAVEGIEKGVYYQGHQVGTQREYSDALLMFRLKALAPERYRDRQEVKHDGKVDGKLEVVKPVFNLTLTTDE